MRAARAGTRGAVGHDSAPIYDRRLLLRLWRFIRPHRSLLYRVMLLLPLATLFNLVQPYLVKQIIDQAIVPGRLDQLPFFAAAVLIALLLERLSFFAESLWLESCGQRAMHDLRLALHRHLLSLRLSYFDRALPGRLLARLTSDVESISEAFGQGLFALVKDFLVMLGILVAMLLLSPRLALAALSTMPALILVALIFRKFIRRVQRQIRHWVAQMSALIQEQISGMKVVQIFGRQQDAIGRLDRANAEHRDAYHSAIRYDAALFALVEMLGTLTIAALIWFGGGEVASQSITFGLLVAFIEYTKKLYIPIRDMSLKFAVMQQSMAAAERVFDLLDTDLDERSGDAQASAAPTSRKGKPHVQFRSVTFAYTPGQPVLSDLAISIAPGETLAVVGATGAGKSTLIKLLTRLYPLSSGEILLSGLPVGDIPIHALRRRVVVVSQDVFIFSGTVASNISLGDPAVTREGAEAAAAAVGLTKLLSLEHAVLERGSNLSAGERQLIAFARALARDPEVLVLDEATSSVDPGTEQLIQSGIARLMMGRTSIVIAHRLSTVERASRIIVLRAGELAEEGTHQQLLEHGGVYARLRELQYISQPDPPVDPPGA